MCHGSIDPNILMRDAEARFRAARAVAQGAERTDGPAVLPPELMGGLKGIWARLRAKLPPRPAIPARIRAQ